MTVLKLIQFYVLIKKYFHVDEF